ncbi:hypothetical protein EYF80_026402 [Liparis tanakae]|uniref:Uncharacterized protein n=1 Tax=Liparis tanakae TaxID=230148 RepID=A0A4Z2HD01_9TELE|nr:hypothetical protein EYF80_026402 [Liparis tanakae]
MDSRSGSADISEDCGEFIRLRRERHRLLLRVSEGRISVAAGGTETRGITTQLWSEYRLAVSVGSPELFTTGKLQSFSICCQRLLNSKEFFITYLVVHLVQGGAVGHYWTSTSCVSCSHFWSASGTDRSECISFSARFRALRTCRAEERGGGGLDRHSGAVGSVETLYLYELLLGVFQPAELALGALPQLPEPVLLLHGHRPVLLLSLLQPEGGQDETWSRTCAEDLRREEGGDGCSDCTRGYSRFSGFDMRGVLTERRAEQHGIQRL